MVQNIRPSSRVLFEVVLLLLLSAVPAAHGAPVEKSLIKAADNPTVYWYQNGKYYPVFANTLDVMQNNGMPGWGWSKITTLTSIFLPRGPNQDFISTGSSSTGLLIKLRTDPAVYLVKDGKREFLSFEVFTQRGYSFSDVIDVPQSILNMFPELPRPDFRISTGVTSYTITQGETASIGITVDGMNGFNSPVELFGYNFPPNYVLQGTAWTPQVVTPPPTSPGAFATLKIVTNSSTQVGTRTITLEGKGGGLTRQKTVTLTVNPLNTSTFSVSAIPTATAVSRGESANFTVTVHSSNGFNGSVSLRAIDLPNNQVLLGTGFSPQQITPPANGSQSSTFTIATNSDTLLGTFTVRVEGVSGSLIKSTNLNLTINPVRTQCGTEEDIRLNIDNIRRISAPPTDLRAATPAHAVLQFHFQQYSDLYSSAYDLFGLTEDSLVMATRSLRNKDLDNACKQVQRARKYNSLKTLVENASVDLWMSREAGVAQVLEAVRDGCKWSLAIGSIGVVGPGATLAAFKITTASELLGVPIEYGSDYFAYGKEQAVQNAKANITEAAVNIAVNIKLPQLEGRSILNSIEKGVNHQVNRSRLYFLLEKSVRDPSFHGQLVQALSHSLQGFTTTRIEQLASEYIQRILETFSEAQGGTANSMKTAEGVNDSVGLAAGPSVFSTAPENAAADVPNNLRLITATFDETIQVGPNAATITDLSGVGIPVSQVSASGNKLTITLPSSLGFSTIYRIIIPSDAVRNSAGVGNARYEGFFTTLSPGLNIGGQVIVANTGGVGLNMRATPDEAGSLIVGGMPEGAQMSVIGGPIFEDGYTWWNVKQKEGGQTGWSAVGDWLTPTDSAGLHINAGTLVANTNNLGLRLRSRPGLSGTVLKTLPEGTRMTIIGGPYYVDGFLWWNIRGDAGTGFSAVAYWLFPEAAAKRLSITEVTPSGVQTRDWNGSVTFTLTVRDANGNAVSGATVSGQDDLRGSVFTTTPVTTDSNGVITYTTMVPNGKANGVYTISFIASKNGFTDSSQVSRQVQVAHSATSPPDTTGPNLVVSTPANGQIVTINSITVSGTSSDAGLGNNGISQVTINGVRASGDTISGAGTANWSLTSPLNQGSNTITVVSKDASPNQNSTTRTITVTVNPPPAAGAPVLVTEETSDKAIALDALTFMRSPFPIEAPFSISLDKISRVMLFATNLELAAGETISARDIIVQVEDDHKLVYFPTVEFVGRVPNLNWLISVTFRLPSEFRKEGNMWASIKFRGALSNKVRLPISDNPTREFLSLVEGNPGAPGDNINVNASGGTNPVGFELNPVIPLNKPTNGFTLTVFLPVSEPSLHSLSFNIVSLRPPGPCEVSFGAGGGFVTGKTTLNGVSGFFVNIPQSQIDSFVQGANSFHPGCGFTASDVYIGKVYLYRDTSVGSNPNIMVLDAMAFGSGQGNFSGTRVP